MVNVITAVVPRGRVAFEVQLETIISDIAARIQCCAGINAIWMTVTAAGVDVMACIRAPRSVCGSTDDIKADSTRNVIQVLANLVLGTKYYTRE